MKTEDRKRKILAIGTEWFSKRGGLSTFNRMLCKSLAREGQEVFCYLPEYSEDEHFDAHQNGVFLLKPTKIFGLSEEQKLLKRPPLPNGVIPDIIIGHGVVTGPAMQSLKEDFFPDGKTVLFIHTSPGEIDWHKPEKAVLSIAAKAEQKDNLQRDLAINSDIVAAVGPHLVFEVQSLLSGSGKHPEIFTFYPGLSKELDEITYDFTNLTPEALIIGRIEDFALKGVDIAVGAMHRVYKRWDIRVNGYDIKPKLTIRGSAVGSDVELTRKLKEIESSNLRIQPKNYSSDIEVINEDIKRAAVVLMPSRAEGFGLIALETLSNGRPILISDASGFAMVLKKIAPNEASEWIIPANIDKLDEWADRVYNILKDRPLAAKKVKSIAEAYAANYSWRNSVLELLNKVNDGELKSQAKDNGVTRDEVDKNPEYVEYGVFRHSENQYEINVAKSDFFSYRLAKAFPGTRGMVWFTDPKVIIIRLKILLRLPLSFSIFPGHDPDMGGISTPIWWFRGGASMPIKKFKILSDTKCLIDWEEFEVDKLMVYRSNVSYRDFIYLKVKPEPSVLYGDEAAEMIKQRLSERTYINEEYAVYKDKIITREEYDDGATIIDGIPSNFEEQPELRIRFLTAYNLIICAQSSVYNSTEADILLGDILDKLLIEDNEKNMPTYIENLELLNRNRRNNGEYKTFE